MRSAPAQGPPPTLSRARAALLIALLYPQAVAALWPATWALEELFDLPRPGVSLGGGNAAAGVGAVLALGLFLVALLGGALAEALLLLRDRRRAGRSAAECLVGVAVGVQVLQVVPLWADRGRGSAEASLLLVSGALLVVAALGRWLLRWPFLLAAVAPAAGLVVMMAHGATGSARSAQDALTSGLEEIARRHDLQGLKAQLDRPALKGVDLGGVAWTLLSYGDQLAEAELLLSHPAGRPTPCVALLRATLAGDLPAAERLDEGLGHDADDVRAEYCRQGAISLAARRDRPEVLARLVASQGRQRAWLQPLYNLAKIGDFAAARRLLDKGGYLDAAGRLDPRYYTEGFLHSVYGHMDTEPERRFFREVCDLDALLVALAADVEYGAQLGELLDHGANPNIRLPCGATPLSALLSKGHLRAEVLKTLLDHGADPNLSGAPYCLALDGAPAPREPPLWLLARRAGGPSSDFIQAELLELLLKQGADPGRPDADGKSLRSAFSGEHLEVLKRYPER